VLSGNNAGGPTVHGTGIEAVLKMSLVNKPP